MKRIAIIGAGLAGLTCGKKLQQAGCDVVIFEKSRGIGGRLATRRAEPFYFDHGAPSFNATNAEFQAFINGLVAQGVVSEWQVTSAQFNQDSKTPILENSKQYVGIPAMNAIGKNLAKELELRTNTRVGSIIDHHPIFDTWELVSDTGQSLGEFDWVISAMPVAQAKAFEMLSNHFTTPNGCELDNYQLLPCSVLMLGFDKPLDITWQLAEFDDATIRRITVNSQKPNREGSFSLVIHSTPTWAELHIDEDKTLNINALITSASELLGIDLSIAVHQDLHNWRYADGNANHKTGYLIDKAQKIAMCGDWLLNGDMESAFLSGTRLAQTVINSLE